ncbi:hypothetical protein Tco_1505470 [Tanacetum coccineum]
MKRGYARDFVPLLPAMLVGAAVDQGEGSTQPTEPHHILVDLIPSTSQPPIPSPPHPLPPHQSPPHSPPHATPHSPPYPTPHSPPHSTPHSTPHYSPTRSYEAPLPEGTTSGCAEDKGENLRSGFEEEIQEGIMSESEGEEPEDHGRIIQDIDDDPLVSLGRLKKKKSVLQSWRQLTLSKVTSQSVSKAKSTDKGKRYRRRARYMDKKINTGIEDVNTGSAKVDSVTASKRGQREGKAPMPKELKKRKHYQNNKYTEEDWDAIRAKLEANAELTKDVLGKDLPEQYFSKRMVDMVNQRKKHFAEKRAKAKRNKPMNQSQLRIYMSNYLKNQGTWKLSQLKKLSFEEIKEEFDKLVQRIDTFVPMDFEATKEKLKRYGEELQTKTLKKQKIDDKDVSAIGEKVAKVKEEEPVKRTGKRKKQKARKDPTPLATKSNIVVNWKIFQQGQRSIYQIMRANGADTVYMSFGAMIKDFTREDLIELYRLVMKKYGMNRPKDAYDIVLWSDIRTMFEPPLNKHAI